MKFYDIYADPGGNEATVEEECEHGTWAARDDAEQAAKDAVEMARLVRNYTYSTDQMRREAQAIIDLYEGVGNGSK